MFHKRLAYIGAALLGPWCAISLQAASGVQIIQKPGKLRIEINGKLFTEYCYQGAPHLYYYPVIGPYGVKMTRAYPMDPNSKNESHDHKHHRSLWYSHGNVNGVDFWSESPRAGKIVHDKFLEIRSGEKEGVIRSRNKWVALNGEVVCTDERTFRVYARPDTERVFDFTITIFAGDKPLVLGDTKEGSMAMRLAESMRLKPNQYNKGKPTGHIVQSTGVRDNATWGKRAAWTDYYGPVEGHLVGVAIFDHPTNPRHPTWWHVRNYGLFAANPFGLHYFEGKPRGTGDFTVPAGKSVTFRYRFYIHEGNTEQARVAARYREWAGR